MRSRRGMKWILVELMIIGIDVRFARVVEAIRRVHHLAQLLLANVHALKLSIATGGVVVKLVGACLRHGHLKYKVEKSVCGKYAFDVKVCVSVCVSGWVLRVGDQVEID